MSKKGGVFTATVYRVETKRDGSGRITFDFGADAIEDIHWIEKFHMKKGCSFEVAAIPLTHEGGNQWPPPMDYDEEL